MTYDAWPTVAEIAADLTTIRDTYAEACDCPQVEGSACGECEECHDGIRCRDGEQDHDDDGCEARIDVRLQVYPSDLGGTWAIRWGLSDYDQDHRGAWGASCVSLEDDAEALEETARDLLEQARDAAAEQAIACGEE